MQMATVGHGSGGENAAQGLGIKKGAVLQETQFRTLNKKKPKACGF
ncbi:hypothetical protein AND4_11264 [Vibrio sp. AND4]|nr:hypothetical protein AND4_11264 [Vibrio sp. AND4]